MYPVAGSGQMTKTRAELIAGDDGNGGANASSRGGEAPDIPTGVENILMPGALPLPLYDPTRLRVSHMFATSRLRLSAPFHAPRVFASRCSRQANVVPSRQVRLSQGAANALPLPRAAPAGERRVVT